MIIYIYTYCIYVTAQAHFQTSKYSHCVAFRQSDSVLDLRLDLFPDFIKR